MNDEKLLQMKLTSGEEIVAEEFNSIATYKRILSIILEDDDEGNRIFIMKPFITFIDDLTRSTIIKENHIISKSRPSSILVKQYKLWWDEYESAINESELDSEDITEMYDKDSSGVIRINKNRLH
jgi:hypothetical protein